MQQGHQNIGHDFYFLVLARLWSLGTLQPIGESTQIKINRITIIKMFTRIAAAHPRITHQQVIQLTLIKTVVMDNHRKIEEGIVDSSAFPTNQPQAVIGFHHLRTQNIVMANHLVIEV